MKSPTVAILLSIAASFGGGGLSAQIDWSVQASGSNANLWGVTYGSGQFVAVGEGGTILTSPDGAAWTKRESPTNRWLLAVASGAGYYVIAGDFVSPLVSTDGVLWYPDGSGLNPFTNAGAAWYNNPRRLNGVAIRTEGGRYVRIVGEDGYSLGGTLSDDWSVGATPGVGWLRGVAFGAGEEVRVGRDGVVLGPAQHPEGRLNPPVGANLEGVVYAREQFVAVGQGGAIFTSADAVNWIARPRMTGVDLYGVAFFNGEFVTVGTGGAIRHSGDTQTWGPADSRTVRTLRAVAASAQYVVAVGESGAVVRSGVARIAPGIALAPADATSNVGGIAAFRVVPSGSGPLAFQWFKDGRILAGATGAALVVEHVTTDRAGQYAVRVANETGSVMSPAATLVVQPGSLTPIVDSTFRGDASLDGRPTALLPLPDGRVLLALNLDGPVPAIDDRPDVFIADREARESLLVRLLAGGGIDSAFGRVSCRMAELALTPPTISQMVVQPDGNILVRGLFTSCQDVNCNGLVRLTSGGKVDPAFVPPADLPVGKIAVQPNGGILVLSPPGFSATGSTGVLTRLRADGSRDSSFSLVAPAGAASVGVTDFAIDPAGRVVVAWSNGILGRNLADGSEDRGFTRHANAPLAPQSFRYEVRLFPLTDGRLLVGTSGAYGIPGSKTPGVFSSLVRIRTDGTLDPAFPIRPGTISTPPTDDGRLYYDGKLIAADGISEMIPNLGVSPVAGAFSALTPAAITADGHLLSAARFTFYNGVPTAAVVRLNAVSAEVGEAPRVLTAWLEPATVRAGQKVAMHVAAVGPGPLTYEWSGGDRVGVVARTNEPNLVLTPPTSGYSGSWRVRVLNSQGGATSPAMSLVVQPAALRIVGQPRRISLEAGKDAVIRVDYFPGSEPSEAVWRRDGTVVDSDYYGGSNAPYAIVLGLRAVTPAMAGSYTLSLRNSAGDATMSEPIMVTVGDSARFVDLSTRALVGAGERAAILGFVIPPGADRTVVLRGIGPGLGQFGMSGVLTDPVLELYNGAGRGIWLNDDWEQVADGVPNSLLADEPTFRAFGAFPLTAGSRDAALRVRLAPGSYTARLRGAGGAAGVGLIELYEADNNSDRILDVSSRMIVGSGATTAIAGFAIRGPVAKRVLVRAAGSALAFFGVGGTLVDPRLEIRDEAGRIVAGNDDWQDQAAAAEVTGAIASVGAFAFVAGSKDAALVVALPAGNYSALVTGADGGTGVALVEIYELPVP